MTPEPIHVWSPPEQTASSRSCCEANEGQQVIIHELCVRLGDSDDWWCVACGDSTLEYQVQ
jgi:hypothetical protein